MTKVTIRENKYILIKQTPKEQSTTNSCIGCAFLYMDDDCLDVICTDTHVYKLDLKHIRKEKINEIFK